MNIKLETALNNVEATYGELVQIANDIINPITARANALIDELNIRINSLTIDQIRDYMLRLQLAAFEISEVKEKSALKADLAAAIQKENFAITFNSLDGSATLREKLATVANSDSTVAETLYNLIANLFKTKVDQLHRLVAVLSSILISRTQEAKFMNIGTDNIIPNTTNGRVILNENR